MRKLAVVSATLAFVALVAVGVVLYMRPPAVVPVMGGNKMVLTEDLEAVKAGLESIPTATIDPATLLRRPDSLGVFPGVQPIGNVYPGALVDTFTQDDEYGFFKAGDPLGFFILNNSDVPIIYAVDLERKTTGYSELLGTQGYVPAPPEVEDWVIRPRHEVTDSGIIVTDDSDTAKIQLDYALYSLDEDIEIMSDLNEDTPYIKQIQDASRMIIGGLVPNASRQLTMKYISNTVTLEAGEIKFVPIALIIPRGAVLPPMWEFDIKVRAVKQGNGTALFNVSAIGEQRWLIHMKTE